MLAIFDDMEQFPLGWTVTTAGAGTIAKSNNRVHSGLYSAFFDSPAIADQAQIYRTFPATAKVGHYHIGEWVYIDGRVGVVGEAFNLINAYSGANSCVSARAYLMNDSWYLGGYTLPLGAEVLLCRIPSDQWLRIDAYYRHIEPGWVNYYVNGIYKGTLKCQRFLDYIDAIYIGDSSIFAMAGRFYLDDFLVDTEVEAPTMSSVNYPTGKPIPFSASPRLFPLH